MSGTTDEVFSRGTRITSDFDTGNPALAVFDETLCYLLIGEQRPVRQDVHLGCPYRYRPRLLKVGLEDGRRRRVIERVVEGVQSWDDPTRNPFKLAKEESARIRRPRSDVPVGLSDHFRSPEVPI